MLQSGRRFDMQSGAVLSDDDSSLAPAVTRENHWAIVRRCNCIINGYDGA